MKQIFMLMNSYVFENKQSTSYGEPCVMSLYNLPNKPEKSTDTLCLGIRLEYQPEQHVGHMHIEQRKTCDDVFILISGYSRFKFSTINSSSISDLPSPVIRSDLEGIMSFQRLLPMGRTQVIDTFPIPNEKTTKEYNLTPLPQVYYILKVELKNPEDYYIVSNETVIKGVSALITDWEVQ